MLPQKWTWAGQRQLEQLQVVSRVPHGEHPPRLEYELTKADTELLPVLAVCSPGGRGTLPLG